MPKVSVIIPTYNREGLITRAIDSVLKQTFTDYEIIIIDDGSKDNTREVLKKYTGKIVYTYQENKGISTARNRGIQSAQGEYIAFLDSDDQWAPEKLADQVHILDTYPKVGIVYGRMPILNEQGQQIGMKPAGASGKNFDELIKIWGDLPTSTVMTRKECFNKVGLFDSALPPMEDIDMWIRISQYYDLYEIEGKVLAYYYQHGEQITQNQVKVYEGLVKIYRKILSSYKNIPVQLMQKRIATEQYILSRIYFKEGEFAKALNNVTQVVFRFPWVGIYFIDSKDSLFTRLLKLVKPFGFYIVCLVKTLVSCLRKNVAKPEC